MYGLIPRDMVHTSKMPLDVETGTDVRHSALILQGVVRRCSIKRMYMYLYIKKEAMFSIDF